MKPCHYSRDGPGQTLLAGFNDHRTKLQVMLMKPCRYSRDGPGQTLLALTITKLHYKFMKLMKPCCTHSVHLKLRTHGAVEIYYTARAGPCTSCRPRLDRFLAGRRKRRPEKCFRVVTLRFIYVSLVVSLFRFLCVVLCRSGGRGAMFVLLVPVKWLAERTRLPTDLLYVECDVKHTVPNQLCTSCQSQPV